MVNVRVALYLFSMHIIPAPVLRGIDYSSVSSLSLLVFSVRCSTAVIFFPVSCKIDECPNADTAQPNASSHTFDIRVPPLTSYAMPRARSLRSLTIAPNAKRNASPGPPSPTYSDTSHASAMNFGANGPAKIITRAHLKASLHAYEEVRRLTFCSLSFLLTPLFSIRS